MITPLFLVVSAAALSVAAPSDPASKPASAPAASRADRELSPAASTATLQDEVGRWSIEISPYLWAPTLKSKTDAGTVKLSFSDILDDLDFTFMTAMRAQKSGSPWGLMADVVYMDLEDNNIELQSTILTAAATYRLQEDDPYKVLFGGRYWDVDVSAGPFGGGVNWVDPIVGVTTAHKFSDKFSGGLTADVGGFGIGAASDITWQGVGLFDYQVSDKVTVGAGYRWLHVDQEQKTKFDTDVYGPIAGLRISL